MFCPCVGPGKAAQPASAKPLGLSVGAKSSAVARVGSKRPMTRTITVTILSNVHVSHEPARGFLQNDWVLRMTE